VDEFQFDQPFLLFLGRFSTKNLSSIQGEKQPRRKQMNFTTLKVYHIYQQYFLSGNPIHTSQESEKKKKRKGEKQEERRISRMKPSQCTSHYC
jgi:hypothetical protein